MMKKYWKQIKWIYIACILIGMNLVLIPKWFMTKSEDPTIIYEKEYPSISYLQELNQENVLFWLNYFEIKHPEIVLAQSILECSWEYNSYRAKELNNIFGFQISETDVLTFGHWIGSIIYYKKWQDIYYQGGGYIDFLMEYRYAEDTLYDKKLILIVEMIESK